MFILTKAMMLEEVVELANHSIGPLPTVPCLVAKEVHLTGDGLTHNTKHRALPWDKKVYWPGLERITWIVHV